MKQIMFRSVKWFVVSLLFLLTHAYAGAPLWTFTPLTATTISLSTSASAIVQYQVTNQSTRAHTLALQTITGVTQVTGGGACANPFTLASLSSCILTLQVNGSQVASGNTNGPVVCQQGSQLQCYRPHVTDTLNVTVNQTSGATTLSASVPSLALKTSGNARIITITNTGANTATNLSISYPTWPSGTTAGSSCGSSLNAGDSCTITITPGANATSSCNAGTGSAPTPGVVTVSAGNASAVTTNVVVLTFACIYEQGYLFAIDDTTATSTSIGGTIASLYDNATNTWSNGFNIITNAQSLTDGATNTATIIAAQGAGTYAAATCASYTIDSAGNSPCLTGTCYDNWYQPAICQMGASGEGAGCSAGTPNMVTNLPALISGCTGAQCLSGDYWSSSEFSTTPANFAWFEVFSSGGSNQFFGNKASIINVRCSRSIT